MASNSSKSARHRAKLKAKYRKQRLRAKGLLKVRKPGGRMKRIKRRTPRPRAVRAMPSSSASTAEASWILTWWTWLKREALTTRWGSAAIS